MTNDLTENREALTMDHETLIKIAAKVNLSNSKLDAIYARMEVVREKIERTFRYVIIEIKSNL